MQAQNALAASLPEWSPGRRSWQRNEPRAPDLPATAGVRPMGAPIRGSQALPENPAKPTPPARGRSRWPVNCHRKMYTSGHCQWPLKIAHIGPAYAARHDPSLCRTISASLALKAVGWAAFESPVGAGRWFRAGDQEAYAAVCARPSWMKRVRRQAHRCTGSSPEEGPLRLLRHKVAAHRSGIMPPRSGRQDTVTTKLASLLGVAVIRRNGRYVAPAMTSVGSWESSSDQLLEWSLTKTWESLRQDCYSWLDDDDRIEALGYALDGGARGHEIEVRSGREVDNLLRASGIEVL